MASSGYIRWFSELALGDVPLVGGKNASLGELVRNLAPLGVRVPDGFAVTGDAYRDNLTENDWQELHSLLDGISKENKTFFAVHEVAARCRDIVHRSCLSPALADEILAAYRELCARYGGKISVAVRSSATAEDLPDASFAGQHDSFLNVDGEEEVLEAYRKCCASLFTERAISYRLDKGFDHFKVRLSVGIMKMVRSDIGSAGVIFTLDTETGHPDVVFLTGSYGLGENVVQGAVDPDEWFVHKPIYKQGYRAVLSRRLGRKQLTMVYSDGAPGEAPVRNTDTPKDRMRRFCLTDEQVLELAGCAVKIEDHYSALKGSWQAMDIEWALDGDDGLLYIVQARPETAHSAKAARRVLTNYRLVGKAKPLSRGQAVGTAVAQGTARVVREFAELARFKEGEILVATSTTPDWEPIMKRAAGIVTDHGGRTCHAAIVARELGIPAVIGCGDATGTVPDGAEVTIDCSGGETGTVMPGKVEFRIDEINLDELARPRTKIMVNLGNPELAFKTSLVPNDGVGLARMEFIINEYVKVHPMALIHPERVDDPKAVETIRELTAEYADGGEYMVQRLSEGVGMIAAAFYPRPVVVRLSDFKTNEYASLIGGRNFEPLEDNPMIGFRGASRYYHPAYEEGFALECRALKRVREAMGLLNMVVMIPFCRTLGEAKGVQAVMEKNGLKRGENGLEIYCMAEIPNNVILINQFSELYDGFSIGSNDLTQLTLGVDRDSSIVQSFDERDPGVKEMIRQVIEGCKRNGRHSGICGQAPSDYPEMAEFVVRAGIDSMSLTPDSVMKTTVAVRKLEERMGMWDQPAAANGA
ncbi:phosphoenolpyruvate synthase [Hyaloraphidium curvatum]|nr:phosphoenolpyruvate synthase [Hyaloraphidium curvatum]